MQMLCSESWRKANEIDISFFQVPDEEADLMNDETFGLDIGNLNDGNDKKSFYYYIIVLMCSFIV